MGLDYSIDLYFRVEDIEKALLATAEIAWQNNINENIKVALPDGQVLVLPFTSDFKTHPVELSIGNILCLDTVILFPEDEAIRQFFGDESAVVVKNGKVYYPLGMIYLYIACNQHYVRFAFTAATSDMSILFVESSSIQQRFFELLRNVGGVIGLINVESWEYRLLENPNARISDDSDIVEDELNPDIDGFVNRILEARAYQESRWQKLTDPIAFYTKWVYRFERYLSPWSFIDDLEPYEQPELAELFRPPTKETTDEILNILFSERSWLARCVASCLVAFTKRHQFTPSVGSLLLRYPHYAQAFCFVLAYLGGAEAIEFLIKYLDKFLSLNNTNPDERELLSVDWALAALVMLDTKNGTENAPKYLSPNGLWTTFVEHGFDDYVQGESRPNWAYEYLKDWLRRWDLDKAQANLQAVFDFAERYFGEQANQHSLTI